MLFLTPNQQCQSTEGTELTTDNISTSSYVLYKSQVNKLIGHRYNAKMYAGRVMKLFILMLCH